MDQREAFEEWAKDSGYALLKTGLNQYFYGDTGAAWDAWQAACAQGGEALPVAWWDGDLEEISASFERHQTAYHTIPVYEHPAPPQPDKWKKITPAMIEAGAQRLVRWDKNSTWPDSWSALDVAAARQDAERVLLSALSVMGGDEHWAGTPEQEIETLREMVEKLQQQVSEKQAEALEAHAESIRKWAAQTMYSDAFFAHGALAAADQAEKYAQQLREDGND